MDTGRIDFLGHEIKVDGGDSIELRLVCVTAECATDGVPLDICSVEDGDHLDSLLEMAATHINGVTP